MVKYTEHKVYHFKHCKCSIRCHYVHSQFCITVNHYLKDLYLIILNFREAMSKKVVRTDWPKKQETCFYLATSLIRMIIIIFKINIMKVKMTFIKNFSPSWSEEFLLFFKKQPRSTVLNLRQHRNTKIRFLRIKSMHIGETKYSVVVWVM